MRLECRQVVERPGEKIREDVLNVDLLDYFQRPGEVVDIELFDQDADTVCSQE